MDDLNSVRGCWEKYQRDVMLKQRLLSKDEKLPGMIESGFLAGVAATLGMVLEQLQQDDAEEMSVQFMGWLVEVQQLSRELVARVPGL